MRRSDGREFEGHVADILGAQSRSEPTDTQLDTDLDLAGYEFWPWADAPARALVKIGWHPCTEAERQRMYEGPPEGRGFCEYGGDWLALKYYEDGRWHAIFGQDKDRKVLTPDDFGTFLVAGSYVGAFNAAQGWEKTEKPNMVLCYPHDSRITSGTAMHMKNMKTMWGLELLEFPDFVRSTQWQQEWEMILPPDNGESIVAVTSTMRLAKATAPRKQLPAITSTTLSAVEGAASSSNSGSHEPKQSLTRLDQLTVPNNGGKSRNFQKTVADRMRKQPGIHLVKGPPGIGKTRILSLLMGYLLAQRPNTRGDTKPHITLFVAPFIDLCKQFIAKTASTLELQLGNDWKSKVVRLFTHGNESVLSLHALECRLNEGARVFVSTEASADRLLQLAVYAELKGYKLLILKDEAHYCSKEEGKSMQLMRMAKLPERKSLRVGFPHRGVICSATPTKEVKAMCDYVACDILLRRAISHGFCLPYEIYLPLLTEKDTEGLPVDIAAMATKDVLGAGVWFIVDQMLDTGARRCIVYARDGDEKKGDTKQTMDYLEQACALRGVACDVAIIVQSTRNRQAKYDAFATNPTSENDGVSKQKIRLQFLIAISILDFGIDIPACDSIGIPTPPTCAMDVESAHRLIQRMGRAMRGEHGVARIFLFTSLESPWLTNVRNVLRDFDPDCYRRIRVRSANPVKKHTKKTKVTERTALNVLVQRYDFKGSKLRKRKREKAAVEAAKKAKKARKDAEWKVEEKSPEEMAATLAKLGVEKVCNSRYRIKDSGDPWTLCEVIGLGKNRRCMTCFEKNNGTKRKRHLRRNSCPCAKWGSTKCWNNRSDNRRKDDPMRQHCRTCRNGECTPESHAAKEAEMRAKHAELTRVTVRHVAPATGPKVPGNAEHGAMLNDEGEVPAPGEVFTAKGITYKVCTNGQDCKSTHNFIAVSKMMGKTRRYTCIACASKPRSPCPAEHLPRPEGARPCRQNPGQCPSGMVNGVEWWKGMSCNSDCAAAIARVIRAKELGIEEPPAEWKRPAFRQERKAGSELHRRGGLLGRAQSGAPAGGD